MDNSQQFNYGISKIAQDIQNKGISPYVRSAAIHLGNKKMNSVDMYVKNSEGSQVVTLTEDIIYGGFPTKKNKKTK